MSKLQKKFLRWFKYHSALCLAQWRARSQVPVIGELILCSHFPGGNAFDRRQYYRHPQRHLLKEVAT